MFIRKLIIGLLSFYAIEIRKASSESLASREQSVQIEHFYEIAKKREQAKKQTRQYDKRKWKQKVAFAPVHFKLKGGAPKDRRFSNQRNLRRMYRNV